MLLQGLSLGIDTENPDEFVALLDPETEAVKATATIVRSDAQTIDCRFETPPAAGIYTLKVAPSSERRHERKPSPSHRGSIC